MIYKKSFRFSLFIFIGLFLLLGLFQGDHDTIQAVASWSFVDGGAATGINYDTTKNATDPVMAVYNNELYTAWAESNGSVTLIRVKKYNGTSWSFVDGTNGLNKDYTKNALHPALIVFNGNLYAAWDEANGSYEAIRVRRYDGGTTWTQVDGDTAQGLNRVATPAYNPNLVVFNGELYLAWEQSISAVSSIHVKKYVSGTNWSFVDGDTDSGLNHAAYNAFHPNLAVCNSQLYLGWTELNGSSIQQIRVCQYGGGSTWTSIDGNGTNGLNLSSSYNANAPWLVSLNNTLYAAWDEPDSSGNEHAHLKRYDGSSTWTFVDSGYLNRMTDLYAYSPKIAVFDNIAYITWDEEDQDPSFIPQIRVKKYDGSTFSFIDGGVAASQLNYSNSKTARTPYPVIFNGDLYVTWYELNGTITQIRVKKYPLPPVVTSVTVPADGWYKAGQNLDFTVTFNKAVNVAGSSLAIPVTLSSGIVDATYLSGSGTTALTFRYPVASGNYDTDGIAVGSSISLYGCTIRDTVNSLDAEVNLNSVASTTGVLVDGVAPTKSSTSPADDATGVGATANLIIYFSENITKGTGNITIRKTSDDSIVETISVGSASVTVSTNSATIDPSVTFESITGYYVQIASTAFSDAAGNNYAGISGKNQWNFTSGDTVAPSGYTVSIDQEYINNNNKTAMSFTFAGAEVGATYDYTLSSSGGGGPLTGSGTITSANQQVTGVTTFGLNEGTLTLYVTLTDTAANTGDPAMDTVLKDTLMPSEYSVSIDQSYINNGNKNNLSFHITGAETGASYSYSVSSSGGGTPVPGGGFTSGSTESVIGVDVSGLGDGTLTVSLTMTDVPGNPGLEVTDTVTKDTMAPAGYSVGVDQPYINNINKTALSFSFTGAEVGASYNYSISSSGGGTPVTGSGSITSATQTVTGIDVSGLNDGTLTLSVTLTDAAGNTGTAATDTVVKDTVPPSGYTIAIDQAYINNGNKTALSFTFTNGRIGTTYNYTLTSSGGGDPVTGSGTVSSATQSITGITTFGLGEGTLTLSVTLTDTRGNVGVAATDTVIKDTLMPAGYTVSIDPAVVYSGNKNAFSFTISGAEVGASYTYSITSNGGGTPVTGSGTASSSTYQHTGISVVGLSDGILTLSLTMTDVAGNPGSEVTDTVVKDVAKPSGYSVSIEQSMINNANKADLHFTFAGAEVGATYNYTLTSSGGGTPATGSGTVGSATQHITGINTTGLNDGTLTFSVILTDTAGNNGLAATATVGKDTVLPTVILSDSDADNLAKAGIVVTVTATFSEVMASTPTITITNGGVSGAAMTDSGDHIIWTYAWTIPAGNDSAAITVAGNDAAGNAYTGSDSIEFTIDNTAPLMLAAARTNNTHITVTLNENCKNLAKTNDGGFIVHETGNPSITYAVTATAQGADPGHVVLTVANMRVSAKEGVTVKYTAGINGTVKDMAGNSLATNSTGVVIDAWDTTTPTLVSVTRTDNTHLTVELSETCVNLTNANNGGFTVEETGNPGITYPVSATAQGTDTSHVVLTVTHLKVSAKEGVTVKYTEGGNGIIQDIAGNAMDTDSTGIAVAAWDTTAPTITLGTLASSNSYIDVVFSEGVYAADNGTSGLVAGDLLLTFTANGGNATNAVISSVKKNDNTVEASASALTGGETTIRVFLTVTGIPSGVETIEIKPADGASIYDRAGNAVSALETTGVKTLYDKLAPTLVSAVRTNNTHITVTLSEE